MKIRQGFVSNSSTSSFVGFGAFCDDGVLEKAIEELTETKHDPEDWDFVYNRCEEYGLHCCHPYDYGQIVGLKFDQMKDDETKAQFFERTFDLITRAFGEKIASQVGEIEEAWRDG